MSSLGVSTGSGFAFVRSALKHRIFSSSLSSPGIPRLQVGRSVRASQKALIFLSLVF